VGQSRSFLHRRSLSGGNIRIGTRSNYAFVAFHMLSPHAPISCLYAAKVVDNLKLVSGGIKNLHSITTARVALRHAATHLFGA
jgi:hypothetical protein